MLVFAWVFILLCVNLHRHRLSEARNRHMNLAATNLNGKRELLRPRAQTWWRRVDLHRIMLELLIGGEGWVLVPAKFFQEHVELPARVSELLLEELVLTQALLQLLAILLCCGGEHITF